MKLFKSYIDMIRRAMARINTHLDVIYTENNEGNIVSLWRFFEVGRELQFIDECIQECFLSDTISTNSYGLLTKWFSKYERTIEDIINDKI